VAEQQLTHFLPQRGWANLCSEMKKRKKKTIDVGKEARRAARKSGIAPAVTRVIPDKRKRPPKHKGAWLEGEVD
jgi:hypothetical protein